MKVLGLGHSHIVAIAKGCYGLQNKGATIAGAPFESRFIYLYGPEFAPILVGDPAQPRINPRLAEIIAQERPAFVLLSVGGNEHVALSVSRQAGHVDFVLGENPELPLDGGAAILPEAAIRETMREHMGLSLSILGALRRAAASPLVCIEPPPPLPDSQIRAYPKEFFKKALDARMLSSELFRYKMWRVQSQLYREACATLDIAFVPVPERFIAPPGVLAREAWGADASHANAAFGETMVEQAIRMMEARQTPDGRG